MPTIKLILKTPPAFMDALQITRIPTPGLERPVRIAHITDVHIGKVADDDPEAAMLRDRMEGLYGQWGRDFESYFGQLLRRAEEERTDAIFLTGDAVNFPTPAAVEFTRALIERFPRPVYFISGNHDWTFPYQPRCNNALRIAQLPLAAPLFHDGAAVGYDVRDLGGIQVLSVDNSTYQIDAVQLAFVRQRLGRGSPSVLLMHIPITQPVLRERTIAFWGQPILMDDEMDAEARRQWNVEEPAPETAEFINLLRASPNLRGVFCGHVHFGHEETFSPAAMQYVGAPGFEGGIRLFEFEPA